MSEIDTEHKIFDEIDLLLNEIQEHVEKVKSDTSSKSHYERIWYMMEILSRGLCRTS